MKEKRMKIGPWRIWLIMLVGLAIAAFFTLYSRNIQRSIIDIAIIVVFFLIVFVIFCLAYKNIRKAKLISNSLMNVADEIVSNSKEYGIDGMRRRLKIEEHFEKSPELKNAYNEYRQRSVQLKREGSSIRADISDYINYDFVEESINSHFLNQIPGIMVGLGILGTFFGLSVGLNSFTIGTDAKDMLSAIQPLMDGIKTAFHTSIYGMIYSLFFNYRYRNDLVTLQQSVDVFVDCYENYIVSSTRNGSETTAVRYQEQMVLLLREQNEQMKEMKRSLVSGINTSVNNAVTYLSEKLDKAGTNLSDLLGEKIDSAIVPELQGLSSSLGSFTAEVAKDQSENLEMIVNSFIEQMNEQLDGEFKALADILNKTSNIQEQSIAQMEIVIGRIGTMAVDLAEMNEGMENTIKSIEQYSSDISQFQNTVSTSLMNLNIQTDTNNELFKSQTESLNQISELALEVRKEMVSAVDQAAKMSEDNFNTNQKLIDEFKEAVKRRTEEMEVSYAKADQQISDRLKEISESSRQIINQAYQSNSVYVERLSAMIDESVKTLEAKYIAVDQIISERIDQLRDERNTMANDIAEAGANLSSVLSELNNSLGERTKETFITFDKELAEITKHLAGTIEKVDQTVDKVPMSVNGIFSDMDDRFKEMQLKLDQYLEYADKLHHNIESKWNQLRQLQLGE